MGKRLDMEGIEIQSLGPLAIKDRIGPRFVTHYFHYLTGLDNCHRTKTLQFCFFMETILFVNLLKVHVKSIFQKKDSQISDKKSASIEVWEVKLEIMTDRPTD